MSVRQVAERLNVSTATVHRLIEVRDLGHVRIGMRTIRVPESALASYLERCTVRCLR
ncbi:MAG: helix-turn-helix domain-containing protein [Euzebya sp.]